MSTAEIEEQRDDLKALADRDDLRVSDIAAALLEVADESGANS